MREQLDVRLWEPEHWRIVTVPLPEEPKEIPKKIREDYEAMETDEERRALLRDHSRRRAGALGRSFRRAWIASCVLFVAGAVLALWAIVGAADEKPPAARLVLSDAAAERFAQVCGGKPRDYRRVNVRADPEDRARRTMTVRLASTEDGAPRVRLRSAWVERVLPLEDDAALLACQLLE